MKLIECVPNFSEGRNKKKIERIANAIRSQTEVRLLHVDPGYDANRTVMTLVGPPESVLEAVFQGIRAAAEVIDMRKQTGAHPRIGATDVCPIIPYRNTTMEACIQWSHQLAKHVGDELGIPVYLYNRSAHSPNRENLATIRRGEYETFHEKMALPDWKPDYGPDRFNARSGATVIGARDFLVAFNINLATDDVAIAQTIASRLRESGVPKKDDQGHIIRDEQGHVIRIPGLLKACKAIGWTMKRLGCAQVSTNLTDIAQTLPHQVYEACKRLAEQAGTRVTGSELIGMVPLSVLLRAGSFYLSGESEDEPTTIQAAITAMGLDAFSPFIPDQRILEYALKSRRS